MNTSYFAPTFMAVLLTGLVLARPATAQDLNAGKTAYAVCLACHAADGAGNQPLNSPAIAGQEDWYLERQINYFKEGLRGKHPKDIFGAQMVPMMMTLPDEAAVKNVAAYIASLPPTPPAASTVKGDVAKGKQTFLTICATCHGQDAKGQKVMNAPNLTLLQDWYLERQLKHFKEGIRGADPKDIYGQQMRPMAMTLPDDQTIKDVVAFIDSLK